MTRESIYSRLREIGCSVETADATAEALEGMSDKKIEAFIYWAIGFDQREASINAGIGQRTFEKVMSTIRKCGYFT